VITKEPKGTSRRPIDLGPVLVEALTAHHQACVQERRQYGLPSAEPGLVFVQLDGSGYHPDRLSMAV